MVQIALNLWGGQGGGPDGWAAGAFNLYDLASGLNRHNWQRVMEALALARGKRLVIFDPAPAAGASSWPSARRPVSPARRSGAPRLTRAAGRPVPLLLPASHNDQPSVTP